MLLYKLTKNNNKKMEAAYGKYYARPVVTQTIGISGLADHMSEHNTGFSPGAVQGLLTDMVKCIRELVLQGIAVKIENLAIFSLGIRTKSGADSVDDFSVAKNIEGVKLRARATGNLMNSKLDILAQLKSTSSLVGETDGKTTGGKTDSGDTPSGGGNTPSGGGSSSTDQGGSSTDQGGSSFE